jgi:hypothetical protein
MDPLFINPSTHPLPLTSLPKLLFILSPAMDPFNALSTAAATREIPPLREAPPTKVMSCALVTSTDLERPLDAAKEVNGGAGVPPVKMVADQPTPLADRPWFVTIHPPPPVMRAGNHQHAKVPLVPKAMEHTRLVLFPLIQ